MMHCDEVASIIEKRVRAKVPFSFVRLGDGEGGLLDFGSSSTLEDIDYFKSHFGNATDMSAIINIRDNLLSSIESADLIGVRDDIWYASQNAATLDEHAPDFLERFRSEFPLRAVEREINLYSAKRVFRLYKWSLQRRHRLANVCSQWVCYDLALEGFWERLITSCGSIGLIHCSPTLPQKIERELGVKVESILVPEKANKRAQWSQSYSPSDTAAHFPTRFEEVSEQLRRPLNGKIYLVGAGLVGKKYLDIIKHHGGIAIDVGALLDSWDGRATRPLVYEDKLSGDHRREQALKLFRLDYSRLHLR
ncbi:hypothetical protein CES85_5314 [Ochrobactrum quorumnocens]|uniref:GT-D fold-like domain-containing protein n=2 Tax=Ochrobactrum quorumnocens TaxID=271865 RepID=A0A248UDX7_9HYPH|nr:hypothetical protein CES85_5314 [[Ochrobactrum] quorumnocens]